jgi:hypothetical protein
VVAEPQEKNISPTEENSWQNCHRWNTANKGKVKSGWECMG